MRDSNVFVAVDNEEIIEEKPARPRQIDEETKRLEKVDLIDSE